MIGHEEKLYPIIIEGTIEGRKTAGRPKNLYILMLKNNAAVNTYVKLKTTN